MKQKDIWLADLNPVKGQEQKGVRPVVIVSGNAMNDHLSIVIICPLTSNIKNFAGCLVLNPDDLNQLEKASEVLTFQVRTLTKIRLLKKIGQISETQLSFIKNGLMEILTY